MSDRDARDRSQGRMAGGNCWKHASGAGGLPGRFAASRWRSGPDASGAVVPQRLLRHPDGPRRERNEAYAWAAEIGGCPVGLLGLAPGENGTVRIRWFRLEPEWRHTSIAGKLIRHLYEHCNQQGYLRVVAEGRLAPAWFWRLFPRHGFHLNARQDSRGWEELHFVLDLSYSG